MERKSKAGGLYSSWILYTWRVIEVYDKQWSQVLPYRNLPAVITNIIQKVRIF